MIVKMFILLYSCFAMVARGALGHFIYPTLLIFVMDRPGSTGLEKVKVIVIDTAYIP